MMRDEILYQKAILIIKKNRHNPSLNGAFIAKCLGINRMYLHRKLKKHCNKNAGELIQNIRIEIAEDLLKNTNKKITNVAQAVGFKDNSYFTKKFKMLKGIPPSVYRKSKV